MAMSEFFQTMCALSGLTCLMIGILALEKELKSRF